MKQLAKTPKITKIKAQKHKKLKKYKLKEEVNDADSVNEDPEDVESPEKVNYISKKTKVKTGNGVILKSKKASKGVKMPKKKGVNPPDSDEDLEELNSSTENMKITSKKKSNKHKTDKENKEDDEAKSHIKDLEKIKKIDPEFYKFLKENDRKLLEFGLNDSDDDDEEEEDGKEEESDKEEDDEELVHKPSGELEVASDESDYESDEDAEKIDKSMVITLKLLKTWQAQLEEKHVHIETIRNAIRAFSSALASISDEASKIAVYKVDGTAAFNGVVQLCVLHLQPAIYRFLGISPKSTKPIHKCNKWKKVRSVLRCYLLDLTKLFEHVSSTNILTVILKHFHQMSAMIGSFSTIAKPILKRLIVLWSTSEEAVRVLAFLCILKIITNQQGHLNHVLKAMYLSYVRNSKFVSPNTLPGINFMRRSLVEMFALDLNVAYQHAFLYIRQLAIHLRNAIILKKKDSFQAVYNWQFINSIRLWVDLLGGTSNKPQLQPLIYPLVCIITGVIKLIPTAQYFPLRFHCIQALINLSRETHTFIPILPFIIEVLNSNTFNKKHTIVSMKPMQFTCILRLNKAQLAENGFRDEVIENVFGLTLEYLAHESSSLAYSDLVVSTVMALKQYIKNCKISNYSRKIKQLLDKILENSKVIEDERRKITFSLNDISAVQAWETKMRNKGVPLEIYYQSWLKTHQTKKKRQAANTDDINDYDIPVIKKRKLIKSAEVSADGVELFPSDSEDDAMNGLNQEEEEEEEVKPKKQKKEKKKQKNEKPVQIQETNENDEFEDNEVDIVKDLDIDDW